MEFVRLRERLWIDQRTNKNPLSAPKASKGWRALNAPIFCLKGFAGAWGRLFSKAPHIKPNIQARGAEAWMRTVGDAGPYDQKASKHKENPPNHCLKGFEEGDLKPIFY
jgi:hypothetical protein